MRFLRPATEDEMIAEFLRQEYASYGRYGALIDRCLALAGASPDLVTRPDLKSPDENRARRQVFGCYRGYGQPGPSFFTGFPDTGVDWIWVSLDVDELLSTLFIRYWAGIWDSSRSPRELAQRIRDGNVPDWATRDGAILKIRAMSEAISAGQQLPPLILVSADEGQTRVAMEGSTRLTAYALAACALPRDHVVLLGRSPQIARWDEY